MGSSLIELCPIPVSHSRQPVFQFALSNAPFAAELNSWNLLIFEKSMRSALGYLKNLGGFLQG
jgi:hypothetical protein